LRKTYLPAHNAEFCQPPLEEGSAFVEWVGVHLDDFLCEQFDRVVGRDNCISFEGMKRGLQSVRRSSTRPGDLPVR
jgi:hypothetical protein